MEVHRTDPRDIGIELPSPVFRVYFWSRGMTESEEFEVTGAVDVRDVFEWAESNANNRRYEVLAVADRPEGKMGVWLTPQASDAARLAD
jgi:hypothetical protein